MKNILKKLILFAFIFTLTSTGFCFKTNAATATISLSKKTITVGNSVTVTVTVRGNELYGVDLTLKYNSNVLVYSSGGDSGGAGTVRMVRDLAGESSKSYSITFNSKKAGSSAISVSGYVSDLKSGGLSEDSFSASGVSIKVQDKTLSSNANLKSLSLDNGKLSPAFSPSVTTYNVTVPYSVTKCLVYATLSDSKATMDVEGSSTMQVGKNVRKVIVTAPSGAQKTYTINIYRSESGGSVDTPQDNPEITNPLEVVVDDATYVIATDISSAPTFGGFTETSMPYNDVDIPVVVSPDEKLTICYMSTTESDVLYPFIIDTESNTFKQTPTFTQGEYTYLLLDFPDDIKPQGGYTYRYYKFNDVKVDAYVSENDRLYDFYYLYAYLNGNYAVYRYDSRENVLQRYPEFSDTIPTFDRVEEDDEELTSLDKFNLLSPNAKVVVIAIFFAIIVSLILIIFLIMRLIFKNKYNKLMEDDLNPQNDFNEITIDDSFITETKETK